VVYIDILKDLKKRISLSEFVLGDKLPTERELSTYYHVSRNTIRRVVAKLQEEGFVEAKHGSGLFLIKNRLLLPTGALNSINVFANKNGRKVKNIIRQFEVVPATTHMASLLEIEADEPIYHIKRLRFIDDSPYQHEETWLSALKFPDLTYQHMQNSKFAYIEDNCGVKIAGCYETITSCMPTVEMATILKLNQKDPLICMETKAVDIDGKPLDFTILYTNIYEFQLQYFKPRVR